MTDYRQRMYDSYVRVGAAAPDDASGLARRGPALRRLIADHFPAERDARILDIGCGNGALLRFAQEAGYHRLAGVDRSPEQVQAAHQHGLTFVRQGELIASLRAMPAASQDVLLAFDVLEHLHKQEVCDLLAEAFRVLAPNGRIIIHVPNGESPFFGRIRYGDFTHELAFTPDALTQLLRAFDFDGVTCHEVRPVAHGLKSGARLVLWRGIRAALRFYVTV